MYNERKRGKPSLQRGTSIEDAVIRLQSQLCCPSIPLSGLDESFNYLLWCISVNPKLNGIHFWKLVDSQWCNMYVPMFRHNIICITVPNTQADDESKEPMNENPGLDTAVNTAVNTAKKNGGKQGHKTKPYYKYSNRRKSKKGRTTFKRKPRVVE